MPVLNISTGATNQNQGQYAYSLSGVNSQQVYDVAQKLMARLRQYPGFATVSSDYFDNTPNLEIDIRRDQARTYGVSETRILTLLRNAYSQNYLYLIKKPEDQYQVILEVKDSERRSPKTSRCCTSSPTTEKTWCPSARSSPGSNRWARRP